MRLATNDSFRSQGYAKAGQRALFLALQKLNDRAKRNATHHACSFCARVFKFFVRANLKAKDYPKYCSTTCAENARHARKRAERGD